MAHFFSGRGLVFIGTNLGNMHFLFYFCIGLDFYRHGDINYVVCFFTFLRPFKGLEHAIKLYSIHPQCCHVIQLCG